LFVDVKKLQNRIVEKGTTQEAIAESIGIDRSTFYRRLKRGDTFTIGEIHRLVEVLGLSKEEAINIFLAK